MKEKLAALSGHDLCPITGPLNLSASFRCKCTLCESESDTRRTWVIADKRERRDGVIYLNVQDLAVCDECLEVVRAQPNCKPRSV